MYEYIIALCLVTNATGEPVNKCWTSYSEVMFRKIDTCEENLLDKEMELYDKFLSVKNAEATPLIRGFCGKKID